ncbi:MAG TPA: cation-transporting P-type ATPase [Burkholderiaceae bacterium]
MPHAAPHTIVTGRPRGHVQVRVQSLLKNEPLGEWIASRWPGEVQVRLDTGTVRARLSPQRDESAWLEALADAARLHEQRRPARPRRRPRRDAAPAREAAAVPAPAAAAPAGAQLLEAPPARREHAQPLSLLVRGMSHGHRAAVDLRRGLSAAEAARRLARDGPNEIRDVAGRSAWQILAGQLDSVPVALLGASAAISLAMGAVLDAGAIAAVLAANGAIGFVTEREAEQTVSSLRRLQPGRASVLRDGGARSIDARDVVVGDVLLLQPGEPVAADARVIEAHRLSTNEAALTGESLPVPKQAMDALPAGTPLAERHNMVFLGTAVSGGAGRALVVATAERTELGRIRQLAQSAEAPRTRLEQELDTLGRRLAIGAGLLCGGVLGLGLLRGRALLPLLRTTVSLGVAAIPEGLPAVATSLLASSVRHLQRRQIYVRRLDAIENLGAVDVVCLDKTGTLTQNRMSVASLTLGLDRIEPDESGRVDGLPPAWLPVAALCNSVEEDDDGAADSNAHGSGGRASNGSNGRNGRNGSNGSNGSGSGSNRRGSSTELALLDFAHAHGADAEALRRHYPLREVRQRSEHHPYMVTIHAAGRAGLFIAAKGRPDEILERCVDWFDGRATVPLRPADRRRLLALNDALAERGERVLALACRRHERPRYGSTGGLTWLGMVGLADPLRPHLPEMMRRLHAAGIRPLMITGDQPGTARAVAERIGLNGGRPVADASSLHESVADVADPAESAGVFARTSPAMKLQIVRALQQRGHVVAMTGDGINDGPALKTADVGLVMGVSGTDFAHAMSDVVLRDDHPVALLGAIEQGRTAFLNVRKSVRYLVSTNLSELAVTALAVLLGMPEPLDPLALLWTNIATDIWPAIALGVEPAEPGLLERPPVSLREGLLDRREWRHVAADAGLMTATTLAVFAYGLARHGDSPRARTLAFNTLTSSQLLFALAVRSPRPLRRGGLQPNPMLRRALACSLLAQAGTVLLPPLRQLLRTTPIGVLDATVVGTAALLPLFAREALKERRLS